MFQEPSSPNTSPYPFICTRTGTLTSKCEQNEGEGVKKGLSLIIQSVIIFTISVSILPEKDNHNLPKEKRKKRSIPSSCSWPAFTLTRSTQREHLSHIPLSGRCHYMLISSLKARKNLRLLCWPALQTVRTSLLSSILWRWIMASESCSERVPAVAQKCSLP